MTPEDIYLGLTILAAFAGTVIVWNDLCSSSNPYQDVSDVESEHEEEGKEEKEEKEETYSEEEYEKFH